MRSAGERMSIASHVRTELSTDSLLPTPAGRGADDDEEGMVGEVKEDEEDEMGDDDENTQEASPGGLEAAPSAPPAAPSAAPPTRR